MVKLLGRMLDNLVRAMIDIDSWQFGLVPGQDNTNAVFITRLLQEKHIAANKPLYLAFVGVEKACGRESGKVLW